MLIPTQIAFMSSTQTDAITSTLVVILFYYAINFRGKIDLKRFFLLIIFVPLFITVKTTGLIYSIPIFIYIYFTNQYILKKIKWHLIAIIFTIPSLPYLLRIWQSNALGSEGVFVTNFTLHGWFANIIRIFFSNFQTPFKSYNDFLLAIIEKFFKIIQIELNPDGFSSYGNFFLTNSLHGDLAGNPLFVLLLILASLWSLKFKYYRIITITLFIQLLLIGGLIGWQPWINRFTSTLLLLGSILIAIWLKSLKKTIQKIVLISTILYSVLWIFFNPARSILNPQILMSTAKFIGMSDSDLKKINWDLVLPKEKQYFSVRPTSYKAYSDTLDIIKKSSRGTIYIFINSDDYEYPIWALTDFKKKIYHFENSNKQIMDIMNNRAYLFCTMQCNEFGLRKIHTSGYITLWSN